MSEPIFDVEPTPVRHYGVHVDQDGVVYLHQGRKASNFIALPKPSPFKVLGLAEATCPHQINTTAPTPEKSHWERFRSIMFDPLVQEFLPIPKGSIRDTLENKPRVCYLLDQFGDYTMDLVSLSRLSSPTERPVISVQATSKTNILAQLRLTNICPLVIYGIKPEHHSYINELVVESIQLPRRLILAGDPYFPAWPPIHKIVTGIEAVDEFDLASLPMENIGTFILRRWARGETLAAPLPSRQQEQK